MAIRIVWILRKRSSYLYTGGGRLLATNPSELRHGQKKAATTLANRGGKGGGGYIEFEVRGQEFSALDVAHGIVRAPAPGYSF
jgi:hypothetical protein